MKTPKKKFRPEFINRIDEIIVFHKLNQEENRKIIELMLAQVQKRMHEQEMEVEIDESVKEMIAKKGIDSNFGARPLRRTIQSIVEDGLAENILEGTIQKRHKVKIVADGEDKIKVEA